MNKKFSSEQHGRSMVEMLGVLAIIGVLSVGGIAGYSKAMTKFKVSKSMDQISMLVANIRTLYSGQLDYEGLTTQVAAQLGAVPSEMVKNMSEGTLVNPFGGGVTISANENGAVSKNDSFIVSYSGIGREVCVALVTPDWGSGSSSGLVSITIANTESEVEEGQVMAGTTYTHGEEKKKLPVPLAMASAEDTGCVELNNVITWVYQ